MACCVAIYETFRITDNIRSKYDRIP
jgi:hypothetical protein